MKNLDESKNNIEKSAKILSIVAVILMLMGIFLTCLILINIDNISNIKYFLLITKKNNMPFFFIGGLNLFVTMIISFILSLISLQKISSINQKDEFITFGFWLNVVLLLISIIMLLIYTLYSGYDLCYGCLHPSCGGIY